MKKIIYSAMAVAMLATTSCKDDFAETFMGEEATVEFSISTPEIGTRAYSDGMTATKLQYAVYDAEGKKLSLGGEATLVDKATTVKLELTTGESYQVIFWAAAENAPYTVTFTDDIEDAKMEVNYANAVSNDENRDAFYKYHTFTVNGVQTENIELKRPFAQLNIGTNDYTKATEAGYTPTKSAVTVKNIYNTLNLASGAVSGNVEVTFDYNAIPGKVDNVVAETFPVAGYEYLAMNYLLVPADKGLVNVEFGYKEEIGEAKTRTINNVPVRRNFRTNIYGKLLTSTVDVNVEINPEYEVGTLVYDKKTLQDAIDAATGDAMIYLGADITGDVTVIQKPDVRITIDGSKTIQTKATAELERYKFEGTIKVHSNSNHYADAALTLKNIDFKTSTASRNFIEALENGSERYSTNITVKGCTFEATGEAVNTAVGVQVKATRGVTVKNCTATNMHSLIQAQSCDTGDVKVIDCTVNGKNGVAFKQVKSATVEGTTITAAAYGIRFDGNIDNYGITVNNNTVTAAQPFIVRKMTGKNNTITLEGTNTLTTEAEYQIVITKNSDDEAYAKPTGTYTLTGADDYEVYPRDYQCPIATWDEFTAALAAGETKVKLTADITHDANYQLQKDVVINLGGYSMTLPMINIHKNVTIKNGTINGKMYARTGCKATLEGLTFSGTISDNLSTEGHLQVQGGCDIYAKNCTFAATTVNGTQTRSLSIEGSSSGIRKFEGCDFKFLSWGTGAGMYKKNVYINTMNGTTTVDFTDCKLNGKAPNIIFAAAYPLTNLTMSGCDNTAPTLEISRAKDAVTEEEWAHISSLIANNKFTKVRLFYAGGSNEYIYSN